MGWMPGWFKSILNMVTYRAIQGGEIPVLYKYRKPDAKDLYRVQGYVDALLEKQVRKMIGRKMKEMLWEKPNNYEKANLKK